MTFTGFACPKSTARVERRGTLRFLDQSGIEKTNARNLCESDEYSMAADMVREKFEYLKQSEADLIRAFYTIYFNMCNLAKSGEYDTGYDDAFSPLDNAVFATVCLRAQIGRTLANKLNDDGVDAINAACIYLDELYARTMELKRVFRIRGAKNPLN